ncbi:hypothetical protein GCM10027046_22330 [Uliginosibacterium flavum]
MPVQAGQLKTPAPRGSSATYKKSRCAAGFLLLLKPSVLANASFGRLALQFGASVLVVATQDEVAVNAFGVQELA